MEFLKSSSGAIFMLFLDAAKIGFLYLAIYCFPKFGVPAVILISGTLVLIGVNIAIKEAKAK